MKSFRKAIPAVAFNVVFVALSLIVFLRVLEYTVEREINRMFDTSVDHRPRPGNGRNPDGLGFRGTAEDISEHDFNVIFMGDSFAGGWKSEYHRAYPYVTEALLKEAGCAPRVRVISFGWTSSSPLLGLRMLVDIGAKYKPDLIIYALDLTDFHNDLRYEALLRMDEATRAKHSRSIFSAASQVLSAYGQLAGVIGEALRRLADDHPLPFDEHGQVRFVPEDEFFVIRQPLGLSRPFIEAGVTKNLLEIERYAASRLQVPTLVVFHPRHVQYSSAESPNNWEAWKYPVLGPYALEPFRYFEEEKHRFPFAYFSLLGAFQSSAEFPLYLDKDPHWSEAGHRVAATALAGHLIAEMMVPCGSPGAPH